jgi:hypothetical protein
MAWPDPGRTASYDKTALTMGRSVDPILWPMLCAKSQLIDRIPKESVDNVKFEWETANTVGRTVAAADHGGATTFDGHATNAVIAVTEADAAKIQKGCILRNASRATPIGTYLVDEIMQVNAIAAADSGYVHVTVKRNFAQPVGSTADNGSTAHVHTDTLEVLWSPKEEGSSADANRYTDVSIVSNYTNILDFYLTVTGSQLASKRLVAGDSLQRQFDDRLVELKNDMEAMLLYGALNPGAAAVGAEVEATWQGSDSYVRTTRGVQSFINVTGGNIDYTSLAVTEEAINTRTLTLLTNGVDMSDTFILVAHPANIRTISAFGADKVRITQAETKWGRALKSLETDLGVELELVPCLNCSKSDLFILDTKKIKLAEFRPFVKMEWGIDTANPDGTDAWKQRYLGEYGVKVVDGTKSHALISSIAW